MNGQHPRAAFGVPPSRGQHLRPGKAGSAMLLSLLFVASSVFAQADEARAKKIAGGSCFLCHGAQGESTSEVFPRLAGQHAEYVAKQLNAFKSGQRKSTAMAEMVAKLTPVSYTHLRAH